MPDPDALGGGGKVLPLRPKTIDDGEIRLGPARLEPLTVAQEAGSRVADRTVRCRTSTAEYDVT